MWREWLFRIRHWWWFLRGPHLFPHWMYDGVTKLDDASRRIVRGRLTAEWEAREPKRTWRHDHVWKRPTFVGIPRTPDEIQMALCGYVCDCGAVRINLGPARGFYVTEPQQREWIGDQTGNVYREIAEQVRKSILEEPDGNP